jgi:hypothetical protein
MAHALDVVTSIVRGLGVEPVIAQRNYATYVLSPHGVGQVSIGLRTWPLQDHEKQTLQWAKRGTDHSPWDELLDDVATLHGQTDCIYWKRVHHIGPISIRFRKGERERAMPLLMNDEGTFTLGDVLKAGERLCSQKDDGRIRLVSTRDQDKRKWYIDTASTMQRQDFINRVNAKEDRAHASLERFIGADHELSEGLERAYVRELVHGFVLTPDVFISFPTMIDERFGDFSFRWDKNTSFPARHRDSDMLVPVVNPQTSSTKPFGVHIYANAMRYDLYDHRLYTDDRSAQSLPELARQVATHSSGMTCALAAYGQSAHFMEEHISQLNALHLRINGKAIEDRRETVARILGKTGS